MQSRHDSQVGSAREADTIFDVELDQIGWYVVLLDYLKRLCEMSLKSTNAKDSRIRKINNSSRRLVLRVVMDGMLCECSLTLTGR
jgi:hypothetical protein